MHNGELKGQKTGVSSMDVYVEIDPVEINRLTELNPDSHGTISAKVVKSLNGFLQQKYFGLDVLGGLGVRGARHPDCTIENFGPTGQRCAKPGDTIQITVSGASDPDPGFIGE